MSTVDALKRCALFKGFTDTGLQIIGAVCTERTFPKGAPLFVEGMVASSMFILRDGAVKLTSKNKAGEEIPTGELGPGDYLGELALIQQGQRMCTATAAAEVVALEIPHLSFQKLMAHKPQACLKLLMAVVAGFGQKVVDNRDAFKSLLEQAQAKR